MGSLEVSRVIDESRSGRQVLRDLATRRRIRRATHESLSLPERRGTVARERADACERAKDGGRVAGAARCVALRACERATRYPRGTTWARGVFTTRTGQIEYRRDLHPDAVGHLAVVIGDVPLVPERRPLVDLGDQPVRVHLHLVPHAPCCAPSPLPSFASSSSSRQLAPPPRLGKPATVASGGPTRTKYGRILAPG